MQKFFLFFMLICTSVAMAVQLSNFNVVSHNPLTFMFTETIEGKSHDFIYSNINNKHSLQNAAPFPSIEDEEFFMKKGASFQTILKAYAIFKEEENKMFNKLLLK